MEQSDQRPDDQAEYAEVRPKLSLGQKKRLIWITAIPLLLQFSIFALAPFLGNSSVMPVLMLFDFVAWLAVFIFWTGHIRDDETLNQNERRLWWAIIWLGGLAGVGLYFYFRVWLDEPGGFHLPPPPEKETLPDNFDAWN